jgi:hypothetical protein
MFYLRNSIKDLVLCLMSIARTVSYTPSDSGVHMREAKEAGRFSARPEAQKLSFRACVSVKKRDNFVGSSSLQECASCLENVVLGQAGGGGGEHCLLQPNLQT